MQGEPGPAVLTCDITFLDASMSVAADREEGDDGHTQTIAFAMPTVSPTPAADEAAETVRPGHCSVAGFHVVSAEKWPVSCVPLAPLPAQLAMPGFGEEAQMRECNDELLLEGVKLAYKRSGSESELAFIVLPPEWPEHGLSIALRWHPSDSASLKDVSQEDAPTDSEADTRQQPRGVFSKCIQCVGHLCRDTCCASQTMCTLSCLVGFVMPLFLILSLLPSNEHHHHHYD